MYVSKVVQALLGDSSASRNSRLRNNVVLSQNACDSAKVVNFQFSDSGLFGVQCQGPADKGQKSLEAVMAELKSLSSVSAQELSRAKASVITEVLSVLECQSERLEEASKNVKVFGSD